MAQPSSYLVAAFFVVATVISSLPVRAKCILKQSNCF